MSWSLFKTKCAVLTGQQHVSRMQFSQTIADAYHQAILLHFDSMSSGGKVVNTTPKVTPLYQGILSICEQNLHSQGDPNFLQQIGKFVKLYWVGAVITGPTGTVAVTSPGQWNGPYVKQNFDFQIILNTMIVAFRSHLMTLTGTYTSSVVPGVTSSWSGALLKSTP